MKIALVGDIALFGKYSLDGNPDITSYFERIACYLHSFDVVVGNLETPFGGPDLAPKGAKSAYIKSDPSNVELLKFLGINVVNLANNHLFDYGNDGCQATMETLDRHGIKWFGLDDRQVEFHSSGVALHGYCSYNTNPLGVARRSTRGINPLNVARVEQRMRENVHRGLLNIVSIHSGIEHIHQPSRDDIQMARRFAGICPFVYYGHHPHVVQGVEEVDGSIIAYSLGNFCFDDVYTEKAIAPLVKQTRKNKTGLIVELEIENGKILRHGFTSTYADDDEMKVRDQGGARALAAYSNLLQLPESTYGALRQAEIDEANRGRRKLRDLAWYAKRLNWRTVDLVVRARINQRLYRENVINHLSPHDSQRRRG